MKFVKKIFFITIAEIFFYAPSIIMAAQLSDYPHWGILHYTSAEPVIENRLRPIVAYIDPSGQAVDWMFDGIILYSVDLYHAEGNPTERGIIKYIDSLFKDGGLAELDRTVANLKAELSDPDYKLSFWFDAITLDGSDAITRTSKLVDDFNSLDLKNLELRGFYWGYSEEISLDQAYREQIRNFTQWARSKNYETILIPYYRAEISSWEAAGFGKVTMQPNYAFNDTGINRFNDVDEMMRTAKISGIEFEFGAVNNKSIADSDPEFYSASAYLSAADRLNWALNDFNTCYYSSPIADYANSKISSRRQIYDNLWRVISAGSNRATVLDKKEIIASADSYTQGADGYKDANSGNSGYIMAGTNNYPNQIRSYISFDIDPYISTKKIRSVFLKIGSPGFAYGNNINDGQVWFINDHSWRENDITWSNQPALSANDSYIYHNFIESGDNLVWHSVDVTNLVRDAVAKGNNRVDFMIKRETEDNVEKQVKFYSHEGNNDFAPRLAFLFDAAVCQNECPSAGDKQCNGSGVQICALAGGCLKWSAAVACGANQTCKSGVCIAAQSSGSGDGGGGAAAINTPAKPEIKSAAKMTRAEILAKIAQIQKLIAELQKQLQALTGKTPYSCTQITKVLRYGMQNDMQVKCLQEFLKAQGYKVAASGNYDLVTKNAVIKFQQKYASEILAPYGLRYGSGNVGNATKNKLNLIIGGE